MWQASTSRSSRCPHRCARVRRTCATSRRPRVRSPATCGPRATVVVWSRRPIREPPRNWSRRSSRTAPAWSPAPTSISGTAPNVSTRETRPGPWSPRRRSSRAWTRLSLAAVQAFYDTVVDKTIPVASPREAELAKLLENTFRHVNIALVNELAMFAHELGIDVWEAIDAASTKPFGFMRFTPGPGSRWALSADRPVLPVLAGASGRSAIASASSSWPTTSTTTCPTTWFAGSRWALNARRRAVNGSRILLLGLAYKKNTGDARESPAVRVAQLLAAMGAEVRGADPHIVEAAPVDGLLRRVDVDPGGIGVGRRRRFADRPRRLRFRRHRRSRRFILDCRHRLRGPHVEYL